MVSLRVANILLVFMTTLFAIAVMTHSMFALHGYFGLLLAGQVVSAATGPAQRPKWAR